MYCKSGALKYEKNFPVHAVNMNSEQEPVQEKESACEFYAPGRVSYSDKSRSLSGPITLTLISATVVSFPILLSCIGAFVRGFVYKDR